MAKIPYDKPPKDSSDMEGDMDTKLSVGQSIHRFLGEVQKVLQWCSAARRSRPYRVGQSIHIECGHYKSAGELVEITPSGIIVKYGEGLLRFNSEGRGFYITETYDCPGPWFIIDGSDHSHLYCSKYIPEPLLEAWGFKIESDWQ